MSAIIAAQGGAQPVSRFFDWAEPLICDQVLSVYGQTGFATPAQAVATVHTQMWLSLVEGDQRTFDARREELMRLARDANIGWAEIDRANRAVLLELVLVVVTRFRNSDRVRISYVERLQTALRAIKAARPVTLH